MCVIVTVMIMEGCTKQASSGWVVLFLSPLKTQTQMSPHWHTGRRTSTHGMPEMLFRHAHVREDTNKSAKISEFVFQNIHSPIHKHRNKVCSFAIRSNTHRHLHHNETDKHRCLHSQFAPTDSRTHKYTRKRRQAHMFAGTLKTTDGGKRTG